MEVGCGRGSFDYYICQEVFRQVNVLHVVGKFKMWAPQCQEKKETGQATTSEIVLEKCGKKKKEVGASCELSLSSCRCGAILPR